MKQVRYGCFETNSSSMHSLIIMNRDEYYTKEELTKGIYTTSDGAWDIWDEDSLYFGRSPFRTLSTFKDKWMYACASLVKEYKDNTFKELESIAYKYIPNLTAIELPKTTQYILKIETDVVYSDVYTLEHGKTKEEMEKFILEREEKWGLRLDFWSPDDSNYWSYDTIATGAVDEDILSGFLKKNNITLEEFLTNKKYIVVQDGDECGYWQDIKDTGLINMDMIKSEYPTDKDYKGAE